MNNNPRDNNDTYSHKKVLVCYHAHCIDGFTSGWVAHNETLKINPDAEITLLPMSYTDKSTNEFLDLLLESTIPYNTIYIVDFSIKIHVIKYLAKNYRDTSVVILDHHKTAFKSYAPNLEILADSKLVTRLEETVIARLDMAESGASITWKYFQTPAYHDDMPLLIQYVKDYDLWTYNFKDYTRYANKYMSATKKTIENWDTLNNTFQSIDGRTDILSKGKAIQAYHDKLVRDIVEQAVPVQLEADGAVGLGVAAPGMLSSDVGNILAKQSGSFGMTWFGKMAKKDIAIDYQISLRSNKESIVDVSELAERFGGGGHRNAAGFSGAVDINQFLYYPEYDLGDT